jgi:SAM-dependent methyltransferase
MYDYYLGGKDSYPADREAAEKVIAMLPDGVIRGAALQNRKFLGRAVRYLVSEAGVRQFLDIGTGLPTMGNVHEVAQSLEPECHVLYVDHDPVVLAHARDLLHGANNTEIIKHDLREPAAILADPELKATLDLSKPVAVLLVAILHFIQDEEDPLGIVKTLMDAVPPGSYLVISHATADAVPECANVTQVYENATSRLRIRTYAEVEALFAGCELVDPGKMAWPHDWHPDQETPSAEETGPSVSWCGVARKA